MKKLTSIVVIGQITGLIVVQGLELWRPGVVSTVVPIGLIWLTTVASIGVTALLSSRTTESPSALHH